MWNCKYLYQDRVFQPPSSPIYGWLRDQSMNVTTQMRKYLVLDSPLLHSHALWTDLGVKLHGLDDCKPKHYSVTDPFQENHYA
jgi:hypothetical protein